MAMTPEQFAHAEPPAEHHSAQTEFSEFFAGTWAKLEAFIARRSDPDTAQDIAADVFLITWHRWATLPTDASDRRAWLYGVAKRKLSHNHERTRRRRRLEHRLRAEFGPPAQVPDPAQLGRPAVLEVLPPAQRSVVELVVLVGFTTAEAGELLGCPRSTVTTRLSRALTRLRTVWATTDTA